MAVCRVRKVDTCRHFLPHPRRTRRTQSDRIQAASHPRTEYSWCHLECDNHSRCSADTGYRQCCTPLSRMRRTRSGCRSAGCRLGRRRRTSHLCPQILLCSRCRLRDSNSGSDRRRTQNNGRPLRHFRSGTRHSRSGRRLVEIHRCTRCSHSPRNSGWCRGCRRTKRSH